MVIHGISLPPGEFGTGAIDALFTNGLDGAAHPALRAVAHLRVSSHLLIERDGRVLQYVPLTRRAWHAGLSRYHGRTACNDFAIGIELEGTDDQPYADAQYDALDAVLLALFAAWPHTLGPHRITGHADIAPGRKTDPGPAFDWGRVLRRAEGGRGATPGPGRAPPADRPCT